MAHDWIGAHEQHDRTLLYNFMGVDPVVTEWCAAFVNSVLAEQGIEGSASIHAHPLLARSFLDWGQAVSVHSVQPSDIVVFPRGTEGWQGHVGFYVDTVVVEGIEYWAILGGNQQNSVNIALYDPNRALAVRRPHDPVDKEVLFDKTHHTVPYDVSFGPV